MVLFQHPVVKVVESDNEMVISDYYTDEFIAKKIFYNDQQQSGQNKVNGESTKPPATPQTNEQKSA